ncbi:MAG: CpcT/CpeT family chromophore lyase [Rhodospirillaceae bacterium]|nr:CpcT/CpeT family chromophore lyase [Rhodospirillaceae bacterium]
MKKFLTATVVALACAMASPALAYTKADLEAQLKLLMEWWPGRYDNNEQIVRQSGGGLGKATDKPMYRLHSIFQRVTMPELGDNVLYLAEYKNNNPADIARIRLYTLAIDEKEQAIVVKFHTPLDTKALLADHRDLSKVEKLTKKDVRSFRDVCNVYLHWEGGQFRGGMKEKSCNVNEDKEWFQYQVIVGPRHYWARDRRFSYADNSVTWEMAPGSNHAWFEQTKARWMACEVLEDPNGDMTKTKKLTDIELHDQGGEAAIKWPDGRNLRFVIHTRAFTSPSERTFPLFRIHDAKDMTVPIAYAYAIDDSERYGLNLGWFYIRCGVKK